MKHLFLISAVCSIMGGSQCYGTQEMLPITADTSSKAWKISCESTPWPARDYRAFPDHETLNYTVRWGAIKAGRGVIQIQGIEPLEDRSVYYLSMTLETTGITSSLHAYRENTVTWLDRATLLPLRYKKETREGHYARDEDVTLEPSCARMNRVEHRLDKDTVSRAQARLPGPTLDILGYLFYLRSLPLKVGARYDLTLVSGDHLYPVTVQVKDRTQVSTSAGWFDCFFIEPMLRSGSTAEKLRQIQVWVTADERKIPVRLRMEANIGHIVAEYVPTSSPSSSR